MHIFAWKEWLDYETALTMLWVEAKQNTDSQKEKLYNNLNADKWDKVSLEQVTKESYFLHKDKNEKEYLFHFWDGQIMNFIPPTSHNWRVMFHTNNINDLDETLDDLLEYRLLLEPIIVNHNLDLKHVYLNHERRTKEIGELNVTADNVHWKRIEYKLKKWSNKITIYWNGIKDRKLEFECTLTNWNIEYNKMYVNWKEKKLPWNIFDIIILPKHVDILHQEYYKPTTIYDSYDKSERMV